MLWSYRPSFIAAKRCRSRARFARACSSRWALRCSPALSSARRRPFKASSPDLADTLKAGGRGNSVGWRSNPMRSLLVVVETALALVALIGAGLFIRSQQNAQKIDPGFESEKLFMMAVDLGALHYTEGQAQQFYRASWSAPATAPGVQSATIAANFPIGGGFSRTVFPEGQDETSGYRGTLTTTDSVTPSFFDTLRIPILEGHGFTDNDRKETRAGRRRQRSHGQTLLAQRKRGRQALPLLWRYRPARNCGRCRQHRRATRSASHRSPSPTCR